MPGKRQVGWPSLLVTYLLVTQEISNSAREAGRNALALRLCKPSETMALGSSFYWVTHGRERPIWSERTFKRLLLAGVDQSPHTNLW